MRNILRLKDHGADFLTRRQGTMLRAKLVEMYSALGTEDTMGIDFDGVQVMAPSFADECFGKFAEVVGLSTFRSRVSLKGANETIRTLVNAVLSDRRSRAD